MSDETIVGVEVTETLCARCAVRRSPLSTGEVEYLTLGTAGRAECDTCGHPLSVLDVRPENPVVAAWPKYPLTPARAVGAER